MSTVYVYTLSDPRKDLVRYVGVTRFPERRAKQHLKPGTSKKCKWVGSLLAAGTRPQFDVIETTTETDWQAREQYWISHFGSQLMNGDAGGLNRLRHSPELRAKISKTLAGRANVALSRPVYAYDKTTGDLVGEYRSGADASREVGCNRPNIVRACKQEKSAGGFFWSNTRFACFSPSGYLNGRAVVKDETRQKLSKASLGRGAGRLVSAETRAKQRISAIARWARV